MFETNIGNFKNMMFFSTLTSLFCMQFFEKEKLNFLKKTFFVFFVFLFSISANSQSPGLIYKPAGNALGKSVLDPNADGFTSLTLSGFSGTDYGANSELNMVPLPIVGSEPVGDLTTGGSGGPTDIVSATGNQSCYVLYKSVGGVPYLIFRMRLGGASTSSKGYTFLFDTDGNFGTLNGTNPGYEKEVVMNTGSSGGVVVNTFAADGTITATTTFNIDNYTQRSVALSAVSGDKDYFYDFFVPYSSLGISSYVRIAAATISSAGSGISGTKSDYNGINDKAYGNNPLAIANALISTFPSTDLTTLGPGSSFPAVATLVPVVNSGITTASTSISGTSQEASGTTITVYKNGSSIGTTTVNGSNTWTLTGVSGLVAGNLITAKAQATGKDLSAVSNTVEVTGVQLCYMPVPSITTRVNGTQSVGGTWAPLSGAITTNTIQIKVYQQANNGTTVTFTEVTSATTQYVATDGSWTFLTNVSQSTFNGYTLYAVAINTVTGCVSGYSNVSFKTSGQTGTKTITPSITTTQILASPSVSRSVIVKNNETTNAAYLILYVNGTEISRTGTTIAAGASNTFNYTGFIEGDIVTAKAQVPTVDFWLSDVSNSVVVTASIVQSDVPVITGTYTSGSGKTVTGTSAEQSGTIITLYKADTTLLGTTTVDAFGNWSVSGLTLTTGDVLTAYAKATGKTLSSVSNSVTVQSSAPSAPTVSSPIYAGASSVSGTGGVGTVTIYVDGSPIGTTTGASWTLNGIGSNELYRGAVVTATNTVSGISTNSTNSVTVLGVVSFCITDTSGNALTSKISEAPFNIKITAMDGPNCTGSVYFGFNGTVNISSSNTMMSGAGLSGTFVNGVLTTSIAIGGSGTGVSLSVVNTNDPTATGNTTLDIIAPTAVASSNQTICSGTQPADLSVSTNLSTVSKWQKSSVSDFSSNVTDISNTSTTLTGASIGNLSATTYFRAVLLTGSNSVVYSNVVTITVDAISVGGSIAGSSSFCSGTNSTTLTLSGYTGSISKWQSSTTSDFSSNVTDISNTTNTFTATNIATTTYYRAVVINGVCSSANSSVASVIISSTSVTGSISGETTVCTGTNSTTLTLIGYIGTIQWQSSNALAGTYSDISGATSATYTAANLTSTTYYKAVVTSGSCPSDSTSAATITVSATSVSGSISGATTVCSGTNSTTLTLSGNTGSVQWQSSNALAGTYSDISGATSATYTATDLSSTTYYKAVVTSGACPSDSTSAATIIVSATSVSGSISGATTVCSGTNSATLTLSGNTGSVQWQSSNALAGTYSDISGATSSTYTATDLTATTYYKAVVTSGACSSETTSAATITVSATSVSGSISGATTVCTGTNSTTFTLSGNTGNVQWQSSNALAGTYSDISGATSSTYTATDLSATTYYKAVVTSGACSSETTSAATITVNATSVSGSISGAATVSSGTNSTTLTLSGNTGSVQWQSSNALAGTYSDISGATSTIYTATDLSSTTYYRVVVTNSTCSSDTSSSVVITVTPATNPTFTRVIDAQCGATLSDINTSVACYPITNSIHYMFKIVSQGASARTWYLDYLTNSFKITDLPGYSYNTTYSVSVSCMFNDKTTHEPYGVVCTITTPNPDVKVSDAQCGSNLAELSTPIFINKTIYGASGYRFEVTNNGNVYTYDSAINYFRLTSLNIPILNDSSYSIRVSVNYYNTWYPYGDSCIVYTPSAALTKLQSIQCGMTLPSGNATVLYADYVFAAEMYRFEVSLGANVYTYDTASSSIRSFKLTDVSGLILTDNTTYSVRVAIKTAGVWQPYGQSCNVTTCGYTHVIDSQCGTTLSDISSTITCYPFTDATKYVFKIVTQSTGAERYVTSTTNSFNLSQAYGTMYDTSYDISVGVYIGVTFKGYGSACTITTPYATTTIRDTQCRSTLTTLNATIYTSKVFTGASVYRFEVTNNATIYTYDSSTNYFNLTNLNIPILYGDSYSIRVAVKYNNVWHPYGDSCIVYTPAAPQSKLQATQCGITLASGNTTVLYATAVSVAQMYRFEVSLGANVYTYDTASSSVRSFKMTDVVGLTLIPGTTYGVRVAIKAVGVWQPYGQSCNVTTYGVAPNIVKTSLPDGSIFNVIASPNPFTESFSLMMTSPNDGNVNIMVYDIMGKLVDQKDIEANEISEYRLGNLFPAGVYNLIIKQNENYKMLRVIKR